MRTRLDTMLTLSDMPSPLAFSASQIMGTAGAIFIVVGIYGMW